jgi:hypothetical protein
MFSLPTLTEFLICAKSSQLVIAGLFRCRCLIILNFETINHRLDGVRFSVLILHDLGVWFAVLLIDEEISFEVGKSLRCDTSRS